MKKTTSKQPSMSKKVVRVRKKKSAPMSAAPSVERPTKMITSTKAADAAMAFIKS